jgi:hypothetical protein
MDALMERVFEARIKLLREQLKIAVQQRDKYAQRYFNLTKIPHAERSEFIQDDNRELEQAVEEKKDSGIS